MRSSSALYADILCLVVAVILLISFGILPWISLLGIGLTGLNIVLPSTIASFPSITGVNLEWFELSLIPLAALVAAISCGIALISQERGSLMRWITLAAGVTIACSMVLQIIRFSTELSDPTLGLNGLNLTGLGFWITVLGAPILILQALISRTFVNPISSPGGYIIPPPVTPNLPPIMPPAEYPSRQRPTKELANAWLIERQSGQRYPVYLDQTAIGRSRDINDVILTNDTVSREHALIRESNGQFIIYDRASAYGVQVNGRRINGPWVLQHNDHIVLGEIELDFVKSG